MLVPLYLLIIALIVEAVILIGPAVAFIYFREQAAARTEMAYERLLAKSEAMLADEREAHSSTMDRLHATKNLPPAGVDMQAQYEERQEERKAEAIERRNGGPIGGPRRIGAVEKVTSAMANDVRQRTRSIQQEVSQRKEQAS